MVPAIVSHLFMKACTVAYRDPHMHACIRTCLHARAVLQRVRVVLVQRSADRWQFCFRVLCHRLCAVLRVPIRRHDLRPHRAVGLQQGEHCSPSKSDSCDTNPRTNPPRSRANRVSVHARCGHAGPVGNTQAGCVAATGMGSGCRYSSTWSLASSTQRRTPPPGPFPYPRGLCFLPDSSEPLRCPQLALGASAPVLALGMR